MSKEYMEKFKIEKIKQECPDTKTFILDKELKGIIMPGQFVMVNVTKNGEKIGQRPFSPSYTSPLGITVKRRLTDTGKPGKVTSFMLDRLETDDTLEIQGPNGNSFLDFYNSDKTAYLVAGGCGAAPMRYFAKYLGNNFVGEVLVFLGAPAKNQVLFKKDFEISFGDYSVFEGIDEPGKPGKILEVLKEKGIKEGSQVFVCGPRPLLKAAAELASQYIPDTDIILSTEEIMKCGRGLCGSCGIGGYRACQDGPSFTYETLLKKTKFFEYKRLKSGRRVPI